MVLGRYPNRECVTCGKNADFSFFEIFRENRERRTCNTRIVRAIVIAISILSYIKNTPILFFTIPNLCLNHPLIYHSNQMEFHLECVCNIFLVCNIIVSFYIHVTFMLIQKIQIQYSFVTLFFTWNRAYLGMKKKAFLIRQFQSCVLVIKRVFRCKNVDISRAMIFDKIDWRKEVTPNHIYLHLRKEWTLVLRMSTLLHDASYGPLELIAHQYCLVRVANDDRSVCSITDS